MKTRCNRCNSTNIITADHESCCGRCGMVLEDEIHEGAEVPVAPSSFPLGGERLVDPKLKLQHISGIRTEGMMRRRDRHEVSFRRACEKLNMSECAAGDAHEMWRRLRPHKLGVAQTVAFCIYQAAQFHEMPRDLHEIIDAVRSTFGYHRQMKPGDVIYNIKPCAVRLNLMEPDWEPSERYLIRKHVRPEHHMAVAKMLGDMPQTSADAKVKAARAIMEEYIE